MAKFFTILVALIAAWFAVMLLGYLAVRLLQVVGRLALHALAGLVLLIAAVGSGAARLALRAARGTVRWAIRRLEPSALAEHPAVAAEPKFAMPADDEPDESGWSHTGCGHANRPEARFCGKCGVARHRLSAWELASLRPDQTPAAPAPAERHLPDIVFLEEARPSDRRAV